MFRGSSQVLAMRIVLVATLGVALSSLMTLVLVVQGSDAAVAPALLRNTVFLSSPPPPSALMPPAAAAIDQDSSSNPLGKQQEEKQEEEEKSEIPSPDAIGGDRVINLGINVPLPPTPDMP